MHGKFVICLKGQISMNTLRRYLQNENQRKKGATKMTYHNYPNEWIPTLNYSEIQTNAGQYKLSTQIAVNGYCLVKAELKNNSQRAKILTSAKHRSFSDMLIDAVCNFNSGYRGVLQIRTRC